MNAMPGRWSRNRVKRSSLCCRASSTCLRSVMSWVAPSMWPGDPSSRTRVRARERSHLMLPSRVMMRNSYSVGRSGDSDCKVCVTRARSSGWMYSRKGFGLPIRAGAV